MMNRYPGPRSFTDDDSQLFFGREAEIQELYRLVSLNDLVVLFGDSGSGKTSLLKAGLCPVLEERQFKPVIFRLNNPDEAPELQVCRQLKENGFIPADMAENLSLWEYFSSFWYVDLGEVFTPVFVFDQFEELFTLYEPRQRANFIKQYSAISNRRPPEKVLSNLTPNPNVKVVFSLRSDFLYLLDELSSSIPSILRCRFQLRGLNKEQATEAVTMPASRPGNYASLSFNYREDTLEGILESLSRTGDLTNKQLTRDTDLPPIQISPDKANENTSNQKFEIAAFQLQIVCRFIEEKIIRENKPKDYVVTPDFFGGKSGIRLIIDEFYLQVIGKIEQGERNAAGKMLAKGLVRNGRRIMMEASTIVEEFKVSPKTLDILHEERLLKREARKGDLYYEISHDNLIKPVLEQFKIIEEEERAAAEKLRAEMQLAEEKAETERQLEEKRLKMEMELEQQRREIILKELVSARKQRKLARTIGVLSFFLLLLLFVIAVWITKSWVDSIYGKYQMVEWNCYNEQFDAAKTGITDILQRPREVYFLEKKGVNTEEIKGRVMRLYEIHQTLEKLTSLGDSLFSSHLGQAQALDNYRKALDTLETYKLLNEQIIKKTSNQDFLINPKRINDRTKALQLRILNTQTTIVKNFIVYQREAESFLDAMAFGQALLRFEYMKRMLPSAPEDLNIIQDALKLNQPLEDYINYELSNYKNRLSRF